MLLTKPRYTAQLPDHTELKTGLLRALFRDARMSVEEFIAALGTLALAP